MCSSILNIIQIDTCSEYFLDNVRNIKCQDIDQHTVSLDSINSYKYFQ